MRHRWCCFLLSLSALIYLGDAGARVLDQGQLSSLIERADVDASVAKQLAYRYIKGNGIPKDVSKGLFYLEKAAQLGDTEALNFLKKVYLNKKSPLYNPTKLHALLQTTTGEPAKPLVWPGSRQLVNGLNEKKLFPDGGTGSAFAINESGFFVSNEHVAGHCAWIVLRYNQQYAVGRVVAKDKKRDLALIKVDEKTPYFLKIRTDSIALGEAVSIGGYPFTPGLPELEVQFSLSVGVVGRFMNIDGVRQIQVSAPVASGNSGGPAIDKGGALLGVAVAKIASGDQGGGVIGDNYNYLVSNKELVTFLEAKGAMFTISKESRSFEQVALASILQKASAQAFCYRK